MSESVHILAFDSSEPIPLDSAVSQALIDSLPFYVMLVDERHHIVTVNRAVLETLDKPLADLCGQFCPRAIHGTDEPYPGCPLEEAVTRGEAVEKELYDEETGVWTLSAIYPTRLVDEDGGAIYLHFARDISAEKEGGLELSQSLEHHKAIGRLLERLQLCGEPEQVFEELMDLTMSLSWMDVATAASGFLYQDGKLRLVASRNVAQDLIEICAVGDHQDCVCRAVAESGQGAIISSDDLTDHCVEHDASPHGHATLPLTYEGRTLGVLNFYMKENADLDPSQLAWELRPTILDDYGLQSAISRLAQRLGDLAGLDIDFQHVSPPDLDDRLPADVEVVLYRIAQESLNNVVRHAKAHRVSVLLVRQAEFVTLLVEDDGQGFDLQEVLGGGGEQCIGLMGIQERASLLHSSVVFESAPGRGTTVKATIPLRETG